MKGYAFKLAWKSFSWAVNSLTWTRFSVITVWKKRFSLGQLYWFTISMIANVPKSYKSRWKWLLLQWLFSECLIVSAKFWSHMYVHAMKNISVIFSFWQIRKFCKFYNLLKSVYNIFSKWEYQNFVFKKITYRCPLL